MTAAEIGAILYAEVEHRGLATVTQRSVLGNGAIWIWELAEKHFPGATQPWIRPMRENIGGL